MEILHAEIDDAPEILALQRLAYRTEAVLYDDFEIPPLTQAIEALRAQFDEYTFFESGAARPHRRFGSGQTSG